MSHCEKQRVFIKFCVKNGKSPTETLHLLRETFKEKSKSKSLVFDWHRRFKLGRISTASDYRSGRPRTAQKDENIEKVKKFAADKSLSVRKIAKKVGISDASCQKILSRLGLRRQKKTKNNDSKNLKKKEIKTTKLVPFQHFMAEHIKLNED